MKTYTTILLSIITLMAIGGAIYYVVGKNKTSKTHTTISTTSTETIDKNSIKDNTEIAKEIARDKNANNNQDKSEETDNGSSQSNSNSNNTNKDSNSNNNNSTQIFKNKYLSIEVPNDWTIHELKNGSVNIEKNNYILYINPHFQQASGLKGGRFDEIANGAPSADLVTIFHPAEPCSDLVKTSIGDFTRVNVYVDKNSDSNLCKKPSDNKTHWYFSYYTNGNGYLNYINGQDQYSFVITLSIKVDSVNKLPTPNDPTLSQVWKATDAMINSLKILY